MNIKQAIECMKSVAEKGGPDPDDYVDVIRALDVLHSEEFVIEDGLARRCATNADSARIMEEHWRAFWSTATMQGFARVKPHGYAGDFEIIERIYNGQISSSPDLVKWDTFFHLSDGVNAVRNRADVLAGICGERSPGSLLSVGGGPALDLRTVALSRTPPREIVLLDNDPNAIARGRANLARAGRIADIQLGFECRNAMRWRSDRQFDIVWSSGLFDYLVDKTASFLIKRLKEVLSPGGVMVIGNFAVGNASRAYSEVIGDWPLIHRTGDDLKRIAEAAGFAASRLEVTSDPTGVNLFLVAHG
ncbi:class I SAM-dependent methyltransferase [Pararhizobium sp. BT-229]|uniref:class I SAM-dependent methyltransferase n=1 Tax=Pararhizobium sp. BT-229 TaxID=2986923 RepID=UPI0021F764B9|nr:class I SAM-dependent methyltransferase [Pararhizobium sp. BT-229]MCV9965100.1 class I SAM-dependent methyltransferase [Pararhizobium sp. BT-229]